MTELTEELAALGHQITVVTAFPHYDENAIHHQFRGKLIQRDEHKSIRVIRTYLYTSQNKNRFLVRLLNYISFNILSTFVALFAGPQDVILAPSPPLTVGFSAYIVSRIKRIPYIYNVQDIYPDVVIRLGILSNPVAIFFSRLLERFVYAGAKQVVVLSEGFRANLLRKGVPPEKLTIIPNFVDTDFIRPLPRKNGFSRRFGLDGQFVVMYAGNLGYSQNLEDVLECASILKKQVVVSFVIIGNGARRNYLEDLARQMQLDRVRFIPYQPREAVPSIYATADVSLVTLKKGIALDSVPSKAYSIMASGRPIIACVDNGSDTWTLVEQAECGICIEPEDPRALARAICELQSNPLLRKNLGHNGRKYVVQHNTRHTIARQYHRLVHSMHSRN
jgi:colanic acid biosynthesis glycosyl transferase WcaI